MLELTAVRGSFPFHELENSASPYEFWKTEDDLHPASHTTEIPGHQFRRVTMFRSAAPPHKVRAGMTEKILAT
jgi:hypothetical protein